MTDTGPAARTLALVLAGALLASCARDPGGATAPRGEAARAQAEAAGFYAERDTIWDLFNDNRDDNVSVEVNRYIWNAALEVLDFLPVQAVDPFSGVISFGFGAPPGGGRAYAATVYVQDPALDARSLNVALRSQSGPVDAATQRAVEDAILTRARQLRIAAGRL